MYDSLVNGNYGNTFSLNVRWTDGSPLDFQAWNVNEPNDANGEEECAEFYQGM